MPSKEHTAVVAAPQHGAKCIAQVHAVVGDLRGRGTLGVGLAGNLGKPVK